MAEALRDSGCGGSGPLYVGAAQVGYFCNLGQQLTLSNLLAPGGEDFQCTVRLVWLGNKHLPKNASILTGPLFFPQSSPLAQQLAQLDMATAVGFSVASQQEPFRDDSRFPGQEFVRLQVGLGLDEHFASDSSTTVVVGADETLATSTVPSCEKEVQRLYAALTAAQRSLQRYQTAYRPYKGPNREQKQQRAQMDNKPWIYIH